VEVHHVDGDEHNNSLRNLAWACRSCNTTIGVVMKRAGLGVRTHQSNPIREGARTLAQWVTAVLSMKGKSDAMEPASAVQLIRATPNARRSAFALEIWRIRRAHGTTRRVS
jgi:hypothetical protein